MAGGGAKAQAKHIGLDDHTIILNAADEDDYTRYNIKGWAMETWGNGQIKYLRHFKLGRKDGLEVSYFSNGQKWSEANYKYGWKHGLWTKWYENGQKSEEGHYKNDRPDGLWIMYNEDGTEEARYTYKDGFRSLGDGKKKPDLSDHGANCVCKDCRASKIGKGESLFPDL